MSDNLVKRLRDWENVYLEDADGPAGCLYIKAADRIEELQARVAELGRELNQAKYGQPDFAWSVHKQALADAVERAEAAEAKLAKAVDALKDAAHQHRIIAGMDLMGASSVAYNAARKSEATLAEIGEGHE